LSEERTQQVDSDGQGARLDRYAASCWPDLSRSRLVQLIDEGCLRLDGERTKPSVRLKAGSRLALTIPEPVAAAPQAEQHPLSVLFEDTDIVVIDKPAGMVVHPAAGVPSGTLVNFLLHHVRDLGGIGGELRPGIVHRLDKDTSGAIVVAKNEQALVRLQASFKAREVEKTYVALCHGIPPATLTIETPFGRHPVDRVRMTGRLQPGDPSARRAVTHLKVVERFGAEAARLEIGLETGRTHQIRVHLSEAGHPLLGDDTYGGTRRDKRAAPIVRAAAEALGRQALHAQRLVFPHPRTGVVVRCEAPLPEDFERALRVLRAPVVASHHRR
jgi:23S rRNA pseudouridine1911/1915/1917 synthase